MEYLQVKSGNIHMMNDWLMEQGDMVKVVKIDTQVVMDADNNSETIVSAIYVVGHDSPYE